MFKIMFTEGNKYTGEVIENVTLISIGKDGIIKWANDETFGEFDSAEYQCEIIPQI